MSPGMSVLAGAREGLLILEIRPIGRSRPIRYIVWLPEDGEFPIFLLNCKLH